MGELLKTPHGDFALRREPPDASNGLRAWDAADEYLIDHVSGLHLGASQPKMLVINDAFGALSVGFAHLGPTCWSDSFNCERALEKNLELNSLSGPTFVPTTETPTGPFDVVLIKVPKHNSELADQLHRLRPLIGPNTPIVGAGMVKHVHTSTLELFEKIIGPTKTSLAKKKSRLIFAELNPQLDPGPNPWPKVWQHNGINVHNRGGVFAARKLDIGTRFFLDHLPSSDAHNVVDLGCGNGIVGASYLQANAQAKCLFVDESFAAVESARQTMAKSMPEAATNFAIGNSLGAVTEPASVDLVLCNPPFHASQAIATSLATTMFNESLAVLKTGGELRIVGNRHLGYHVKLKQIFGHCTTIASNPKFVVLSATK